MILNFLKGNKSNLKEELNLEQPTFKTPHFNIYEITERDDLNSFSLTNGQSVADKFNFTQNNWQQYVVSGQVKPLVIANDNNECLAMMLIWSDGIYSFQIRQHKQIGLPITFETADGGSSYINFINTYNATLPLRSILNHYNDYVDTDYLTHLNETADGAYVKNDELIGVFEEFYDMNDSELGYEYTDITLPPELSSQSINYKDRAFSNLESAPQWVIHWPVETTGYGSDSINFNNMENVTFDYQGAEWQESNILDTFGEDGAEMILNPNEEARQRRAERKANAERERQEAEDRQKATEFDNSVSAIFEVITADGYEYDENFDDTLMMLQQEYNDLTDNQKRLQTTNGNLQIAINRQKELKAIYIDEQYKLEAEKFYDSFEEILNKVNSEDYKYDRNVDELIDELSHNYGNLTDGGKEKLVTEFDFNFETELQHLKELQNQAKVNYEANRIKSIENDNVVIVDGCVAIKVFSNYAAVVASSNNKNNPEEIHIPDTINGVKVTRIEKNAFIGNRSIKKIYLPETINYIGDSAFYGSEMKIGIKSSIYDSIVKRKQLKLASNSLNTYASNDAEHSQYRNLAEFFEKVRYSYHKGIFSY